MSDIDRITQLILHERQGRDRGWWDQMDACFHPDSVVSLSWFNGSGADFVARSRAMSQGGLWPLHRMSPPVVHVNGSRAFVEAPASVEVRFLIGGVEAELISYSRLLYRVEQRAGAWKILGLVAIYERDTLAPAVPGTTLGVDVARFSQFRPSYRCLAYHISLRGLPAPDDLYGDDRPERSNALYGRLLEWLRSGTWQADNGHGG